MKFKGLTFELVTDSSTHDGVYFDHVVRIRWNPSDKDIDIVMETDTLVDDDIHSTIYTRRNFTWMSSFIEYIHKKTDNHPPFYIDFSKLCDGVVDCFLTHDPKSTYVRRYDLMIDDRSYLNNMHYIACSKRPICVPYNCLHNDLIYIK
jgi:hypothetical protein